MQVVNMNEEKINEISRFGFRFGKGSVHTARTMMLEDLQLLLSYVGSPNASKSDYLKAIEEDNCLGKRSGITTRQRIEIRKVLQKAGIQFKQGEELRSVPQFLFKMQELAEGAGGGGPKPACPDTSMLEEIRLSSGNEQLLALCNQKNELVQAIDDWNNLAERIEMRWPSWTDLKRLLDYAVETGKAEQIRTEVQQIEQQRFLLGEPDPIAPLVADLTDYLRKTLNDLDSEYVALFEEGMEQLRANPNWMKLEPGPCDRLLSAHKLTVAERPKIDVQSTEDVLKTLDAISLSMFSDRIAAIPERFETVKFAAAKLMVPKVQRVKLPSKTLKTEEDMNEWLQEVTLILKEKVKNGPVIV